jgi:hypothetical protein
MHELVPREQFPAPEESTFYDLENEGFKIENPLIIDLSMSLLIQIVPLEVNSPKQQFVWQATMEETSDTSFRSPHTPISTFTRGGVVPPPPPSHVRTTTF